MPTMEILNDFMEREYSISLIYESNTSRARLRSNKLCLICQGDHLTRECPTFIASDDKFAFLKRHKICAHCLSHEYNPHEPCRHRGTLQCGFCNKGHITEMHRRQFRNKSRRNYQWIHFVRKFKNFTFLKKPIKKIINKIKLFLFNAHFLRHIENIVDMNCKSIIIHLPCCSLNKPR